MADRENALKEFQEAMELFQRCFAVQEYQLNETQSLSTNMPSPENPNQEARDCLTDEAVDTQFPAEAQWTSIVEPITANTLLDTTIAQIETLTVICGLMIFQDPTGLPWLEEYSSPLLHRAAVLAEGTDRVQEVSLSSANLKCSFADAAFRTSRLNLLAYQEELESAFGHETDPRSSARWLCDRADAFVTLIASIHSTIDLGSQTEAELSQLKDVQWKYLTNALEDLTAAAKLPDVPNQPKIHLRRGDCELLRYRLGKAPSCYKLAARNMTMLLRNAEVYYRGAAKLAKVEMAGQEEAEALTKEAVVSSLSGDGTKLVSLLKTHSARVWAIMEEMRDEGLLTTESIEQLGQQT